MIGDLFSQTRLPGMSIFQPSSEYRDQTISSPDWVEHHLATLIDYKVYKEYTTNNNAILNYLFYKKGENFIQLEVSYQRLMSDSGIIIQGIDLQYLDPPLSTSNQVQHNRFYPEWLESLANNDITYSAQLLLKVLLQNKQDQVPINMVYCIVNQLNTVHTPGLMKLTIHNIR